MRVKAAAACALCLGLVLTFGVLCSSAVGPPPAAAQAQAVQVGGQPRAAEEDRAPGVAAAAQSAQADGQLGGTVRAIAVQGNGWLKSFQRLNR
ncbi:MAG: hypothetical protein ACK2UX_03815, partial [Anaerolineae bacterium]